MSHPTVRTLFARHRTFDVLGLTALLWFLATFLRDALPLPFGTVRVVVAVPPTFHPGPRWPAR